MFLSGVNSSKKTNCIDFNVNCKKKIRNIKVSPWPPVIRSLDFSEVSYENKIKSNFSSYNIKEDSSDEDIASISLVGNPNITIDDGSDNETSIATQTKDICNISDSTSSQMSCKADTPRFTVNDFKNDDSFETVNVFSECRTLKDDLYLVHKEKFERLTFPSSSKQQCKLITLNVQSQLIPSQSTAASVDNSPFLKKKSFKKQSISPPCMEVSVLPNVDTPSEQRSIISQLISNYEPDLFSSKNYPSEFDHSSKSDRRKRSKKTVASTSSGVGKKSAVNYPSDNDSDSLECSPASKKFHISELTPDKKFNQIPNTVLDPKQMEKIFSSLKSKSKLNRHMKSNREILKNSYTDVDFSEKTPVKTNVTIFDEDNELSNNKCFIDVNSPDKIVNITNFTIVDSCKAVLNNECFIAVDSPDKKLVETNVSIVDDDEVVLSNISFIDVDSPDKKMINTNVINNSNFSTNNDNRQIIINKLNLKANKKGVKGNDLDDCLSDCSQNEFADSSSNRMNELIICDSQETVLSPCKFINSSLNNSDDPGVYKLPCIPYDGKDILDDSSTPSNLPEQNFTQEVLNMRPATSTSGFPNLQLNKQRIVSSSCSLNRMFEGDDDSSCQSDIQKIRIESDSSPRDKGKFEISLFSSPMKCDIMRNDSPAPDIKIPGLTPQKIAVTKEDALILFTKNKKKLLKSGSLVRRALDVVNNRKINSKLYDYEIEVGLKTSENIIGTSPLRVIHCWFFDNFHYIHCLRPMPGFSFDYDNDRSGVGFEPFVIFITDKLPEIVEGSFVVAHYPIQLIFFHSDHHVIALAKSLEVKSLGGELSWNKSIFYPSISSSDIIDFFSVPKFTRHPIIHSIANDVVSSVQSAFLNLYFTPYVNLKLRLIQTEQAYTGIYALMMDFEETYCVVHFREAVNNSYINSTNLLCQKLSITKRVPLKDCIFFNILEEKIKDCEYLFFFVTNEIPCFIV